MKHNKEKFKQYLCKHENMNPSISEAYKKVLCRVIAECYKCTGINILKLKTHDEFKLVIKAFKHIGGHKTKKGSYKKIIKLYGMYLLHETVMNWL